MKTTAKPATGLDKVNGYPIKWFCDLISESLAHVINSYCQSGILVL